MALSKIECIIKPFKLDEVKDALIRYGVSGITAYPVKGFGRQRGHKEVYRGAEYKVDFIPKFKLEIYIDTEMVEGAIEAILKVANTGNIGDGKIAVYPIDTVIRVRTGEKDMDAL